MSEARRDMRSKKAGTSKQTLSPVREKIPLSTSTTSLPKFAKTSESTMPNAIDIVKGVMLGRIEGFIKARTETPASSSSAELFALETTASPESFKTSTQLSSWTPSNNSVEVESILEWQSDFSYSITWSPQQRKAIFLKLALFQQDGRYKAGSKKCVATTTIDLASLLMSPDSTFITFAPLYSQRNALDRTAPSNGNLLGWVAMGLQFTTSSDTMQLAEDLRQRVQETWQHFLALDTSVHHALLDIPTLPTSTNSTTFQRDPPTTTHSVHIALGDLQLTSQEQRLLLEHFSIAPASFAHTLGDVTISAPSSTMIGFVAEMRFSTNADRLISVRGEYQTDSGRIRWQTADVVLPVRVWSESCALMEVRLKMRTGTNSMNNNTNEMSAIMNTTVDPHSHSMSPDHDEVYGTCRFLVSWLRLSQGLPWNLQLPLRNVSEDMKMGNLHLCLHTSALPPAASPLPHAALTSSTALISTPQPQKTQRHYLVVDFLEGHISNSNQQATNTGAASLTTGASSISSEDVYFEAGLLVSDELLEGVIDTRSSNAHAGYDYRSRTGYLTTSSLHPWDLSCRLLIPPVLAHALLLPTATTGAGNANSRATVVSLGLSVHSSRFAEDEGGLLGRARLALPPGLFQQPPQRIQAHPTAHTHANTNTVTGGSASVTRPKPTVFTQYVTFYTQDTHAPGGNATKTAKVLAGRVQIAVRLVTESLEDDTPVLVDDVHADTPVSHGVVGAVGGGRSGPAEIGAVALRVIGVHTPRNEVDDFSERLVHVVVRTALSTTSSHDPQVAPNSLVSTHNGANRSSSAIISPAALTLPPETFALHEEGFPRHHPRYLLLRTNRETTSRSTTKRKAGSQQQCQAVGWTGNVPVLCAATDLHIEVRTETMLSALATSFPASKALPRFVMNGTKNSGNRGNADATNATSDDDDATTMPSLASVMLELVVPLRRRSRPKGPNVDEAASSALMRMDCQLKLQACFVPYVEGTLFITAAPLVLVSDSGLTHGNANALSNTSSSNSLRLSIGHPASRFVVLPAPLSSSSPSSSSSSSRTVALRVNTYELLQEENHQHTNPPMAATTASNTATKNANTNANASTGSSYVSPIAPALAASGWSQGSDEHRGMLPLLCEVFTPITGNNSNTNVNIGSDTDASNGNDDGNGGDSSSSSARKKLSLVGRCDTAPIYLLALRHLLSSSSSSTSTSTPSTPALLWTQMAVDLCSVQTGLVTAVLPLQIAFRVEYIPRSVSAPLVAFLCPPFPNTMKREGQLMNGSNYNDADHHSVEFGSLKPTNQTLSGTFQTFSSTAQPSSSAHEQQGSQARIELGLKQAFVQADVDGSGAISAAELLRVMTATNTNANTTIGTGTALSGSASGATFVQSKALAGYKRSSATSTGVALGLENTAQLLRTLSPSPTHQQIHSALQTTSNTSAAGSIAQEVAAIFARLDVDGDGIITWCEWHSVLTIALHQQQRHHLQRQLPRPQQHATTAVSSAYRAVENEEVDEGVSRGDVDPFDPLLVTLFAVHMLLYSTTKTATMTTALHTTAFGERRFVEEYSWSERGIHRTSLNNPDTLANETETSDLWQPAQLLDQYSDRPASSSASSKVSMRLNALVTSLRRTNTHLQQRLEDALLHSQSLPLLSGSAPADADTVDADNEATKMRMQTSGSDPHFVLPQAQQLQLLAHLETYDATAQHYWNAWRDSLAEGDTLRQQLLQLQLQQQVQLQGQQGLHAAQRLHDPALVQKLQAALQLELQQELQHNPQLQLQLQVPPEVSLPHGEEPAHVQLLRQVIRVRLERLQRQKQDVWRRHRQQECLRRFLVGSVRPYLRRQRETRATLVLQASWRHHRDRQRTHDLLAHRRHAAIILQTRYRGYRTRCALRARVQMIVRCQARFRGGVARVYAKQLSWRRQVLRLIHAKRSLRSLLRKYQHRKLVERRWRAAVVLQRALQRYVRRCVARRVIARRWWAVRRVQRAVKTWRERHAAMLALQRHNEVEAFYRDLIRNTSTSNNTGATPTFNSVYRSRATTPQHVTKPTRRSMGTVGAAGSGEVIVSDLWHWKHSPLQTPTTRLSLQDLMRDFWLVLGPINPLPTTNQTGHSATEDSQKVSDPSPAVADTSSAHHRAVHIANHDSSNATNEGAQAANGSTTRSTPADGTVQHSSGLHPDEVLVEVQVRDTANTAEVFRAHHRHTTSHTSHHTNHTEHTTPDTSATHNTDSNSGSSSSATNASTGMAATGMLPNIRINTITSGAVVETCPVRIARWRFARIEACDYTQRVLKIKYMPSPYATAPSTAPSAVPSTVTAAMTTDQHPPVHSTTTDHHQAAEANHATHKHHADLRGHASHASHAGHTDHVDHKSHADHKPHEYHKPHADHTETKHPTKKAHDHDETVEKPTTNASNTTAGHSTVTPNAHMHTADASPAHMNEDANANVGMDVNNPSGGNHASGTSDTADTNSHNTSANTASDAMNVSTTAPHHSTKSATSAPAAVSPSFVWQVISFDDPQVTWFSHRVPSNTPRPVQPAPETVVIKEPVKEPIKEPIIKEPIGKSPAKVPPKGVEWQVSQHFASLVGRQVSFSVDGEEIVSHAGHVRAFQVSSLLLGFDFEGEDHSVRTNVEAGAETQAVVAAEKGVDAKDIDHNSTQSAQAHTTKATEAKDTARSTAGSSTGGNSTARDGADVAKVMDDKAHSTASKHTTDSINHSNHIAHSNAHNNTSNTSTSTSGRESRHNSDHNLAHPLAHPLAHSFITPTKNHHQHHSHSSNHGHGHGHSHSKSMANLRGGNHPSANHHSSSALSSSDHLSSDLVWLRYDHPYLTWWQRDGVTVDYFPHAALNNVPLHQLTNPSATTNANSHSANHSHTSNTSASANANAHTTGNSTNHQHHTTNSGSGGGNASSSNGVVALRSALAGFTKGGGAPLH